MVHSPAVENKMVSVPEDGFDDLEFAKYQEDRGELKRSENKMPFVPEDGFDDFEFAKHLEDCGLLRRSHSLPTALTTQISSMVGKVLSMCSLVQTTMAPSNELSDDTCAMDYMETAYSILHHVCSGYDEIRNIVTGGAADGWYADSSPGQSPAPCFGRAPVSTHSISMGNPNVYAMSRSPTSVASVGIDATIVLASNTFVDTWRVEPPEAGDRPIAAILERTRFQTSAAASKLLTEEQRKDASGAASKLLAEEQRKYTSEESTLKTTLMLCNIPHHYSRSMVMDMLQSQGFVEHVEFIYLPMNLKKVHNFGYAFVTFDSARITLQCRERLQGFTGWSEPPEKPMEIEWSETQGLDANIERYKNSPIMHESVQDELKPALFKRGVRVAFPKPTKSIRAPRLRRSGNPSHQNNQSPNSVHTDV
jgi:hypothetical protein